MAVRSIESMISSFVTKSGQIDRRRRNTFLSSNFTDISKRNHEKPEF
jgi:hypothetical protein